MIQLFFKKSKISESDWTTVYKRILVITKDFPLKLQRLESYDGYSPELDKIHDDLIVNTGTPDEHISFWGDQMSFTAQMSLHFYKNWDTQILKGFTGKEIDTIKPVTWYAPEVFDFSGYPPEANGFTFHSGYLETEEALYQYAVLAIGIMLENILPGRVFMVALENDFEEINKTTQWLDSIFKEKFDVPVYFDKVRLLDTLRDYYDHKKDLVGRMDMLYIRQFKKNIQFAIEQIGYQPSFDYYSEVLSNTFFGTFGFSDILDPWIAATSNLESTLQLITKSKQILLSDSEDKRKIENAGKYDFVYILEDLLDKFILWSPEQREQLDHFYTNRRALETGEEDLFGSMMRMGGYRIDICPIYASKEQLLEAFIYHDPKNGNKFEGIINQWIEINANKYAELIAEMEKVQNAPCNSKNKDEKKLVEELQLLNKITEFASQYASHEQCFVIAALKKNPAYMDIPGAVENFQKELWRICNKYENKEDIQYIFSLSEEKKIGYIKSILKDKRLSVHKDFEEWIKNEKDSIVLTSLIFLISLRIYNRSHAFARQVLLMKHEYWNKWKTGQIYALNE